MLKSLSFFIAIVLIGAVPPAIAQDFATGMAVGMSMAAQGNTAVLADSVANVLYVMPRAAERIKDPLEMRSASSDCFSKGKDTFREIFESSASNSKDKEIVQIVRQVCGPRTDSMVLWFVFTDRNNIIPIEKLQPLK